MADTAPDRVGHIEQLMLDGQFVRGKTSRELAAAWGCSVSTVWGYSTEASRRVRAQLNGDHVAVTCADRLEAIADDVATEPKDRIAAMKLLVDIAGAAQPKKIEATVTALTPEQARERLRELAPEVLAALKP